MAYTGALIAVEGVKMGVLKSRLIPGISPSFAKAFGVLGHPLYLIVIPFPSSMSGINSTMA